MGEAYGFGSRTEALAGAGAAWGMDGYAAYDNPAALARSREKRLTISFGAIDMVPVFTPINGVIIENDYVSDKTPPVYGSVDTSYKSTLGTSLGLDYVLAPDFYNLSFGLVTFLPLEQLAYMDTGETFEPEYFMYRARTQRPQFELGAGARFAQGFMLGAGLHIAYTLTSNASVFMQANSSNTSTMRFQASMKPTAAPYFSLYYDSDDKPETTSQGPGKAGNYTLGAVFRTPIASTTNMTLNTGARFFASLAALDFNFSSEAAQYYDPMSLELGASWQYADKLRLVGQLNYEIWSEFQPPYLTIQNPDTQNCAPSCSITISPTQGPQYDYRNILIPRIAQEAWVTETTVLRVGYGYRPSILGALPTGAGNYLDPPLHMFDVGAGWRFKRFLSFDVPVRLDVNASWYQMVSQQIVKDPGNEIGQGTGDLKIGAPGYTAGGKILGGGVSLSLAI